MGRRMKVAVDHGSGEGPEERGTLVAATRGRSGLDRDIPIKNNSPHRLSSIVDRRPAFYSGINRAGWRRKLSSSPPSPRPPREYLIAARRACLPLLLTKKHMEKNI